MNGWLPYFVTLLLLRRIIFCTVTGIAPYAIRRRALIESLEDLERERERDPQLFKSRAWALVDVALNVYVVYAVWSFS